MAEIEQPDDQQPEEEGGEGEGDCTTAFQWDENTQLYFHSSTGFYYSPTGDWYYSSRDGMYYKFENGNYVLLLDTHESEENGSSNLVEGKQCTTNVASEKDTQFVAADMERLENHQIEEPCSTSEWLEDTLIELFLAGYPTQSTHNVLPIESNNDANTVDAVVDESGNHEFEEGEWISNDADQGVSWEEENWKAQYGQVVTEPPNEATTYVCSSGFHFLDLWDWELVHVTNGVHEARLTGRLVKQSSKLHPSLPSRGTRLKTSPVCQVRADLVRVKSGQIYRLRRPSARYLETLSVYDSSNPTSGWGYPDLSSVSIQNQPFSETTLKHTSCASSDKDKSTAYRDRAAERRAFHGGFGVGPGQKKPYDAESSSSPSTTDANPEAAGAESLRMSFGSGSYARRLLENMGWKEGEALGRSSSTNGLLEPLQVTGNSGNAGLGWDQGKRRGFSVQLVDKM